MIVTRRDNRDYIRVLLYSYYTTITGRGVLLIDTLQFRYVPWYGSELFATDFSGGDLASRNHTLNVARIAKATHPIHFD